jgi:hypothetical protein
LFAIRNYCVGSLTIILCSYVLLGIEILFLPPVVKSIRPVRKKRPRVICVYCHTQLGHKVTLDPRIETLFISIDQQLWHILSGSRFKNGVIPTTPYNHRVLSAQSDEATSLSLFGETTSGDLRPLHTCSDNTTI